MLRDCPPRLYKYFAAERCTFFTNLRVRYSQLGAFNDPFEGRPEITALAKKENFLSSVNRVGPEELKRVYEQLPEHVRPYMTYAQVEAIAEHLAQSEQSDLLDMLQPVGNVAAAFITGKIDQVLGVFCVSEVPDSLLMWAHYASSHTGFVVEFDALHPWFHEQKSDEDELRCIRRVYYRDSRPSAPLSEMSALELFLVKSAHWAYEREWRIVRPLVDAAETVTELPYPVALFDVPPTAITGVIMGARMAPENATRLRQSVLANPELRGVKIRRAAADASHFLLRFKDDT